MFKNCEEAFSKSSQLSEIDIRNDEEQEIKFNEIIELLISIGYYRARIKGLTNFDKIVGGMTWCMESCAFDVDVDLLFQDNFNIGQKIALTEKIVAVLPKMNCPYTIEPHQIQGLDCIHIYPIIKWLAKESTKMREIMAEYVKGFALFQYNKKWQDKEMNSQSQSYFLGIQNSVNHNAEKNSNHTSASLCKNLVENSDLKKSFSDLSIRKPQGQLEKILKRKADISNELRLKQDQLQEYKDKSKAIKNIVKQANFESNRQQKEVEDLLIIHDHLKSQEIKFREHCALELKYFKNYIKNIKEKFEIDEVSKIKNMQAKVSNLRLELAKKTRVITSLTRELDESPGRPELTQYQRRFMELYSLVSEKHKETKQYYTLYNTLDDTKLYLLKELSLLNSIQDNYSEAMMSSKGKEQFLNQFELILEGVQKSKVKMEKRCMGEKQRRDSLSRQLISLNEQQRKYVIAVTQLTVECRKNENLLNQLRLS